MMWIIRDHDEDLGTSYVEAWEVAVHDVNATAWTSKQKEAHRFTDRMVARLVSMQVGGEVVRLRNAAVEAMATSEEREAVLGDLDQGIKVARDRFLGLLDEGESDKAAPFAVATSLLEHARMRIQRGLHRTPRASLPLPSDSPVKP